MINLKNTKDDYCEITDLDKIEFGKRLSDWFTQHFKTKDARLHKFLK